MKLYRLAALVLSILPASAAIITNGAWRFYDFEGYFNTEGQTLTNIVENDPLSSNVASQRFIIDPGFQESIRIPFTLTFADAPVRAIRFARVLYDPDFTPQIMGSITAEPIQPSCGSMPCPFTAASFRTDSFGPWVIIGGSYDNVGQSFNMVVVIEAPIPTHILDPGYNAKTTFTVSGPVHYKFTVPALTYWDIDVPEAQSSELMGFGLLGLAAVVFGRCKPRERAARPWVAQPWGG